MFKRILVASDLTEQSTGALKLAWRLAEAAEGTVVVLHVVAMPAALRPWAGPMFRADLASYQTILDRQFEAARQRLESSASKAGVDPEHARFIVLAGSPASVIAKVADDVNADLIVVGRGTGGKLGPVAEHTVRLVGRTVMVAPVARAGAAARRLPISGRRPTGRIGRDRARA